MKIGKNSAAGRMTEALAQAQDALSDVINLTKSREGTREEVEQLADAIVKLSNATEQAARESKVFRDHFERALREVGLDAKVFGREPERKS